MEITLNLANFMRGVVILTPPPLIAVGGYPTTPPCNFITLSLNNNTTIHMLADYIVTSSQCSDIIA